MKDKDYNLLHGFPTMQRVIDTCTDSKCDVFERTMKALVGNTHQSWQKNWDVAKQLECDQCKKERLRRTLVTRSSVMQHVQSVGLPEAEAKRRLLSDDFANSVYITECNKPVCVYGMLRSQHFARVRKQQLLWIQAQDTPPNEHYSHYSKEELIAEKKKWNSPNYHARKTDGIPSLMALIYDMPWRLTGGQGAHLKECGIHNGRSCLGPWREFLHVVYSILI